MFFLALGSVAPEALADANADAEAHIKRGIELRRLGRDVAALAEFQSAFASVKSPRSAAQLGLCEQAVGRWTDSADHLAQALENRADPWVNKNRSVLEEQLAAVKNHVGTVEVAGSPVGAEVLIGDLPVARLPMTGPVFVNSGVVDVGLRASGYKPAQRSVAVGPGHFQKLVMHLEPQAGSSGTLSFRPPESDSTSIRHAEQPEGDKVAGRPAYKRAWFWGVVGGLAAGAIVSVLLLTRKVDHQTGVDRTFPGFSQ